jgi:ATP-dependent Clp protease ATP-binding subunit ClpA
MIHEFSLQLREKKVSLRVSAAAVAWVAKRGFSRIFGAREVARLVQEKIKNPFVDEVLFGRLKEGGSARIEAVKNDLVIKVEEEKKGKRQRAKAKGQE